MIRRAPSARPRGRQGPPARCRTAQPARAASLQTPGPRCAAAGPPAALPLLAVCAMHPARRPSRQTNRHTSSCSANLRGQAGLTHLLLAVDVQDPHGVGRAARHRQQQAVAGAGGRRRKGQAPGLAGRDVGELVDCRGGWRDRGGVRKREERDFETVSRKPQVSQGGMSVTLVTGVHLHVQKRRCPRTATASVRRQPQQLGATAFSTHLSSSLPCSTPSRSCPGWRRRRTARCRPRSRPPHPGSGPPAAAHACMNGVGGGTGARDGSGTGSSTAARAYGRHIGSSSGLRLQAVHGGS